MAAPDNTAGIDEGADPIIAMVNERLTAIEAAVPQDLTKVTPNDSPIGLESLIAASLEGEELFVEPSTDDAAIPHNTAVAGAPGADFVRISLNEVIDGEVSTDTVMVDIDQATRTVALAAVPGELAALGLGVGAMVTAINGHAPFAFLEGGLPAGEALPWDIAVAKRRLTLTLIFKNESGAAEQAPTGDAAINNSGGFWSPRFSGSWECDPKPERVRPPRQPTVNWQGWHRSADDYYPYADQPPSHPVFKQRSPLYDRGR
jgi:hypothetical protein